MNPTSTTQNTITIVAIVAAAFFVYLVMTMPDQRSTAERISDTIQSLPQMPNDTSWQQEEQSPERESDDKSNEDSEFE